MSWKRLKNFALIIIFVFDVVIGFAVAKQYKKEFYYSDEVKRLTAEALDLGGITFGEELLSGKKTSLAVLTRDHAEDDLPSVLGSVFGDGVTAEGNVCTVPLGNGTATVRGDGTFDYSGETPVSSLIGGDVVRYESEAARYADIIGRFLSVTAVNSASENKGAPEMTVALVREPAIENGRIVVTVAQYLNGIRASGELEVYFAGDAIVAAHGSFPFVLPTKTLTVNCADMINILFDEKRSFGSPEPGAEPKKIVSVGYYYETYHDTGRDYYVPFCCVTYSDGTLHTMDLVN